MTDNLVQLELSQFTKADIDKIVALGDKMRLLYRWYRYERKSGPDHDSYVLYSGARGLTPYAAYRVERHGDGRYELLDQRSGELLHTGRTVDEVIDALPEDFYYSN